MVKKEHVNEFSILTEEKNGSIASVSLEEDFSTDIDVLAHVTNAQGKQLEPIRFNHTVDAPRIIETALAAQGFTLREAYQISLAIIELWQKEQYNQLTTVTRETAAPSVGDRYVQEREAIHKEQFFTEYAHIVEKYAEALPPPSPELRYTVVVPAYKEFDHLVRLLQSLAAAKGEFKHAVEILYIVNNSSAAVAEQNTGFVNNQQTLRLLQFIADAQSKEQLIPRDELLQAFPMVSHYQAERIREIIADKIIIHGVDASSEGMDTDYFAQFGEFSFPGLARHIGGCLALHRMGSSHKKWIDFIDGDCYFPEQYFSKILTLTAHSATELLYKPLEFVAEPPPEIEQQPISLQKVFQLVEAMYETLLMTKIRFVFLNQRISGAAPINSTSLFSAVNGYPFAHGLYDEDMRYSRKVSGRARSQQLLQPWLCIAHRKRPESYVGKFDPEQLVTSEVNGTTLANIRLPSGDEYLKILELILKKDSAFSSGRMRLEYLDAKRKFFRLEKLRTAHFLAAVEKWITLLVELDTTVPFESTAVVMDYIDQLPKAYADSIFQDTSSAELCLCLVHLLQSPEIRQELDIDLSMDLKASVWQFLEKYAPDFFTAYPSQEPELVAGVDGTQQSVGVPPLLMRDYLPAVRALNLCKSG